MFFVHNGGGDDFVGGFVRKAKRGRSYQWSKNKSKNDVIREYENNPTRANFSLFGCQWYPAVVIASW